MNGAWPGGPRRTTDIAVEEAAPRLRPLEERLARREAGGARRRRRHRARSVRRVVVVAAVVAAGAGYGLGLKSERSAADIAAEQARIQRIEEGGELGRVLGGQANRVIQQMWLTELAETQLQQP